MGSTAEKYLALDCEAFPTGGGSAVLWDRTARRAVQITETAVAVLRQCDRFRTLQEHRERLLAAGWQEENEGDLVQELEDLASDGLMWRPRDLSAVPTLGQPDNGGVSAVAWITMDRPELLGRSVSSFFELEGAAMGSNLDVVVVDASLGPENRASVRRELREGAGGCAASLAVASRPEKEHLIARLASASEGLDPEVLHFALGLDRDQGDAFGGNLNAALLATAGNGVLCSADDTVFSPATGSGEMVGLEITSDVSELMKVTRFRDRESLCNSVLSAPGSLVERYGLLLGQDVSRFVSGSKQPLQVDNIRPEFFGSLLRDGGRVLIACAGMRGFRGAHDSRGMLEFDTEWLTSHCDSLETYRQVFASREILRAPRCQTITEGGVFLGQTLGWDSRFLIPPFFPFGQNEDGLLAVTMRACHPAGYAGLIPATVIHDPLGDTRRDPEERFSIPALLCYFMIDTIRFFQLQLTSSDPAARMRALGESIQSVADDPAQSFKAWIHELWVSHLATLIRLHSERLEEVGPTAPPYWIADMERFVELLQERALDPAFPIPIEFADDGTSEKALEAFRRAFRLYGRLLTQWPLILEVATDMAAAGEMPLDMISE